MNRQTCKELDKTIQSDYPNVAGMILLKNGKKVYENYFNGYAPEQAVHVCSVTKSVFSALIGIALNQGCLKGIDQKVLDFFPDYEVPQGEKAIQHVTLRNMLTMTAPYKYQLEPYEQFFSSDNWMKTALDFLGGREPAAEFTYSAMIGTHILSGILVQATGKSVLDFATENLFAPLQINVGGSVVFHTAEEQIAVMNDKNTHGWVADPQGIHPAGWGLFMKPADMAKIGQLYLDGGSHQGRQIVPAGWIAESTSEHSRCLQWGNLAYGYLWWIIDGDSFAALGDGGNVIYVNTKEKIVVAMASLFIPDAKDRIGWIKQTIEPMLEDWRE
jgi:CubicO group peptidase (beta-lactamase class C family)